MYLFGCLFAIIVFAIFIPFAFALGVLSWFKHLIQQLGNSFSEEKVNQTAESSYRERPKERHFDKTKGQYVDFEEVKD